MRNSTTLCVKVQMKTYI